MVFRRRTMNSPTQEIREDKAELPLHEYPERVSTGSDSDSRSRDDEHSWDGPRDTNNSDDAALPHWSVDKKTTPDGRLSPSLRRRSLGVFHTKRGTIQIPLFMVGLMLIGIGSVFVSRSSVNYASEQVQILSRNRDRLGEKLQKAEKELHILKREISAMDAMIHEQQALESHSSKTEAARQLEINEMNSLKERLQGLSKEGDVLKRRVQQVSREEIIAKYGEGTKQVEVELVFPDGKKGPTKFVIELANEEMPHSVHTFLEMASSGLLDGCSFILNALHVLKAAPLPYDGSSAAAKAKAFSEKGLESVSFKEYNEAYPHKKYTVGFAADGSPSFYINTEDNTEIHVGDPCFGKIVDGFDTVKRLEQSPTRNGIWYAQRIGIKHARILNWNP